MSDIYISDLQHSVDAAEEYFLAHYGVKGMKWGVRRYQNKDGSLTDAGKKRLADQATGDYEERRKFRMGKKIAKLYGVDELRAAKQKVFDAGKLSEEYSNSYELQEKYGLKAIKALRKEGKLDNDLDENDYRSFVDDDDDSVIRLGFQLFLKDRNVDHKQYCYNLDQAEREYHDACKKVVDDLLGDYGNRTTYDGRVTANDSIVQGLKYRLQEEQTRRNKWNYYF